MKLSQKQISVLATEVFNKVKESKEIQISKEKTKDIESFLKKKQELSKKQEALNKEIAENNKFLVKEFGNTYLNSSELTINGLINKLKLRTLPTFSTIENKIVLESMFTTKEELSAFVNRLVKEFSK